MPKYSWLLFDADGTLFDFAEAERQAIRGVLEDLGLGFTQQRMASYQRINHALWKALETGTTTQAEIKVQRFALWLEELGVTADADQIGHDYAIHLSEQAILLDGAQQLVEELAVHYQLMLITNGLQEVQRPRFNRSALRPHFADIVVSAEIGVAKPEPGIFDEAFRKMGDPPRDQVLMIGDSLSADIAGGIQYQLDTCWCNFGGGASQLPITYTIRELQELRAILL